MYEWEKCRDTTSLTSLKAVTEEEAQKIVKEKEKATSVNPIWSYFFPEKLKKKEWLLQVLSQTAIFEGLSRRKLKNLLRILHERSFESGEVIFKMGEPGIGMYVICEGEVRVTIHNHLEEEEEVIRLTVGQTFGDLALIEDHFRSATVQAVKPTRLLGLIRPEFMDLIKRDPRLGNEILFRLLKLIGERLNLSNQLLVEARTDLKECEG